MFAAEITISSDQSLFTHSSLATKSTLGPGAEDLNPDPLDANSRRRGRWWSLGQVTSSVGACRRRSRPPALLYFCAVLRSAWSSCASRIPELGLLGCQGSSMLAPVAGRAAATLGPCARSPVPARDYQPPARHESVLVLRPVTIAQGGLKCRIPTKWSSPEVTADPRRRSSRSPCCVVLVVECNHDRA